MDTPITKGSIGRNIFSKLESTFIGGVYFIYKKMLTPRSLGEDDKRREFILNIILFSTIILLTWSTIYLIIAKIESTSENGVSLILFFFIFSFFASLYILSRKSYYKLSSYILIFTYFVSITYTVYKWGADLPIALLCYGLIIIIASILISTKFAFLTTNIIAITLITLSYLEREGINKPNLYWLSEKAEVRDAIQYSVIFLIIAIISWLSNRETERSLKRARTSEAALKEQRDMLEITVEARTQELQQAQSEKISQLYRFAEFGRLASGLFHDLMTPLTSVSLYLEQLNKEKPDSVENTKNYLQKAFDATKRIEQFTGAMRQQLQHREAQELFSLNQVVHQAIQLIAHKAFEAKVNVIFRETSQISMFGNPLKFHQVILNLVSNGVDAYAGLAKDSSQKREVAVFVEEHLSHIAVQVQDWGQGIDPRVLNRIYEPFFTTKPSHQGLGIGLSLTKQIVEQSFKGKISMETRQGYGTTFHVTLPKPLNE
jgi:signal transduction histidine kinase